MPPTRDDLLKFKPRHDSFVGVDSDGCVFDTMEIKQKACFHGLIVSHWSLRPIERYVRETAEFVNLHSRWRGQNRFLALLKTFDLLRERPEVQESGVTIPDFPSLRAFIASREPLGNPGLQAAAARTGDKELTSLLQWSLDVNAEVERKVRSVPPFPWAARSLARLHHHSDVICVSQTPYEALAREWKEHHLTGFVSVIAGQELGTKTEHLRLATGGKYMRERVLMIGDALGDQQAAAANNVPFYPINPGGEDASWEQFHDEGYDRFLAGRLAGAYHARLIADFEARLPETPPWLKARQD